MTDFYKLNDFSSAKILQGDFPSAMLLLCLSNSKTSETTDGTSMHQSWAEGETDRRPQ